MFKTLFVEPLYNILVFLVDVIPGGDVGLAIIILTLLVKFILSPLHRKAIVGQVRMKELEPKIKEIKEKYPDKQEQAKKTFELYKEAKVSPLSGCLPILIQLPIIFALYRLFLNGFSLEMYKIYDFVGVPTSFNLEFLGFISLDERSVALALLAGITQFLQARFAAQRTQVNTDPNDTSMQANIGRMMSKQFKYVLPLFVAFISWQLSAAIALYWSVNNIFTTIQEVMIQKRMAKATTKNIKDEVIDVEVE